MSHRWTVFAIAASVFCIVVLMWDIGNSASVNDDCRRDTAREQERYNAAWHKSHPLDHGDPPLKMQPTCEGTPW